ncbi:MAG: hypothetical protein WBB01_08500 [Phormidesmis sp.]
MPRASILNPNQSYTFRSYFEMTHEPDDILAEFGATLRPTKFDFSGFDIAEVMFPLSGPTSVKDFEQSVARMKSDMDRRRPNVRLTSEAARREILIAPIVLALIDFTDAQLRIEYGVRVSDQLKGSLDYYLQSQHNCLVIEAKNADLERGFVQLAVELIALDQWTDSDDPVLYGAVSTGDIWQFGRFHRASKQVEQDLSLYRIPADLAALFQALLSILMGQI